MLAPEAGGECSAVLLKPCTPQTQTQSITPTDLKSALTSVSLYPRRGRAVTVWAILLPPDLSEIPLEVKCVLGISQCSYQMFSAKSTIFNPKRIFTIKCIILPDDLPDLLFDPGVL